MARANLRRSAAETARAEYQPQIRGVRREAAQQTHSLESTAPALQASLQLSGRQLRHAGLSARDLAIAEAELAHRTADAGASTALQIGQVNQEAHGQIVDLQTAQGQAQSAALTTLLHEAAEHRQKVQDEIAAEGRGLNTDIAKAELERKLGLGTYHVSPTERAQLHNGGLTPTQQREAGADHSNAAFYAKQYFDAAKAGQIDGVDADPKSWAPETWTHLIEAVKKNASVDVPVAEKAVEAIREHVEPGSGAPNTPQELLAQKLGGALGNAPAQVPAAIMQFANLLRG